MRPPARIRTAASTEVLRALRARLGGLLEAAGHPRDAYVRGLVLATMLGHGSWGTLNASARREAHPDAFDEALGIDGLELRLEDQASGLLWRIRDSTTRATRRRGSSRSCARAPIREAWGSPPAPAPGHGGPTGAAGAASRFST